MKRVWMGGKPLIRFVATSNVLSRTAIGKRGISHISHVTTVWIVKMHYRF